VHDAVLIAAPIGEIEAAVAVTREAMAEASRIVLDGFEVRTDAKVTRYPQRFTDPRGRRMWGVVNQLIEEAGATTARREVA
jgi:DNA polymerase I